MTTKYVSAHNQVIYLDLDGVCVDFAMRVAKLVEHLSPGTVARVDDGHGDVFAASGLEPTRIWDMIDAHGNDFWHKMPAFPWFEALYHALDSIAPVVYCTATSQSQHSASGKVLWLQEHHSRAFRNYTLGPLKHHVAGPGRILIDDRQDNVDAFVGSDGLWTGGASLLFPDRVTAFRLYNQGTLVREIATKVRTIFALGHHACGPRYPGQLASAHRLRLDTVPP